MTAVRCRAGLLIGLAVVAGAGVARLSARFVCGAIRLVRALGRAIGPRSPGPGRDRAIVGFAHACAFARYMSLSAPVGMGTGILFVCAALVLVHVARPARPHVAGPVPGPRACRTSGGGFEDKPHPAVQRQSPAGVVVFAGAGPFPFSNIEDNLAVEPVLG